MPGHRDPTESERIDLVAPQTGVAGIVLGVLAVVATAFVYSYVAGLWAKVDSFAERESAVEFAARRGAAWTITAAAVLLMVAIFGLFIYAAITTIRNRGSSLTLTGRDAVLDLPDTHLVLPEDDFCRILCGEDSGTEAVATVRRAMRMRGDLRRKLAEACVRSISPDRPLRFEAPKYLPAMQVGGVLLVIVLAIANFVADYGVGVVGSWGMLLGTGEPRYIGLALISIIVTPLVIIGLIVWRVTTAMNSGDGVEVAAGGLTVFRGDDRRSVSWEAIERVGRGWLKTGALRVHTDDGRVKLPHPLESEIILERIIERRSEAGR